MIKKILVVLLVAFVIGTAAVSFATIANTKHNLTSTGLQFTRTTSSSATLCGFCHIPHGGNTSTPGLPLWARKTPNTGSYQLYGGGKTLANTTVNTPGTFSLTCLSCHDGTIGIGTITKNGVDTFFPMTGNVNNVGNEYFLRDDNVNTAYNPLIGTDLRNDHPVGFRFPAGGYTPNGGIPGIGITVQNPGATNANLTGTINGTTYPLYQNAGGGNIDSFECATCHDPHKEDNGTTQTKFLRGPNADLCQECHNLK